MQGLLAQLQEARATMDKIIKQLQQDGETQAAELFKPLFEKHPELNQFSWRQYTVYFNDGDTCDFSAYLDEVDAIVNGEELENGETGEKVYTRVRNTARPGYSAEDYEYVSNPYPCLIAVREALSSIGEDGLEAIFGDHCRVVVTPNAVTVEEYTDHD